MKYSDDKELQKLIFESLSKDLPFHSEDTEYYELLKEGLEKEPEVALPEGFAQQVSIKAFRRKSLRDFYRSGLLYLGSLFLLIGASSFALYFLAKDIFHYLVTGAQNFKYPILFTLILLTLIQLVDEVWVRRKFTKQ